MATETALKPKKIWEKLLIFWHTKNYSAKTYDIAMIMAVAIFTNRKIYEEELQKARSMLRELLPDESASQTIMEYIELKLLRYSNTEEAWRKDQNLVREIVQKDQELYSFLINIFEADDKLDEEEKQFEESIKKAFLRS